MLEQNHQQPLYKVKLLHEMNESGKLHNDYTHAAANFWPNTDFRTLSLYNNCLV